MSQATRTPMRRARGVTPPVVNQRGRVPTFCMASLRLFVVFLATPFFFCPSTSNFFLLWSSSKGLGAASAAGFAESNRSGTFRFFLAAFFAMLADRRTQ